jgi:hypothetical protein
VLFSETAVVRAGNLTTPVLDVSRYAYLGGYDAVGTREVQVTFDWYTDSGGVNNCGTRTLVLSPSIVSPAQYRLPNLGPFVQVSYLLLAAPNWLHTCVLFGTNRVHPLELIPSSPVLIDVQNAAIGATTTIISYPSDYYAGPIQVAAECSQAGTVSINYETAGAVWDVQDFYLLTAGAWLETTIATPPGAWRIAVRNTAAAAGTYYLIVNQSMTGAM